MLQPKEAEEARPPLEPIPDIEWWDARICVDGASYDSKAAAVAEDEFLLRDKITNLVRAILLLFWRFNSFLFQQHNRPHACAVGSCMRI